MVSRLGLYHPGPASGYDHQGRRGSCPVAGCSAADFRHGGLDGFLAAHHAAPAFLPHLLHAPARSRSGNRCPSTSSAPTASIQDQGLADGEDRAGQRRTGGVLPGARLADLCAPSTVSAGSAPRRHCAVTSKTGLAPTIAPPSVVAPLRTASVSLSRKPASLVRNSQTRSGSPSPLTSSSRTWERIRLRSSPVALMVSEF